MNTKKSNSANDKNISLLLAENGQTLTRSFLARYDSFPGKGKIDITKFDYGMKAVLRTEKRRNYYQNIKPNLFKTPAELKNMENKVWDMGGSSTTNEEINSSPIEFFNPSLASYVYLQKLVSDILAVTSKNIPKIAKPVFYFTQPSFANEIERSNYRENMRDILSRVQKDLKLEDSQLPQIAGKGEQFLYEPYAVYYYYLGLEGILDKKNGGTYLIIDAGGGTTDIALIQLTGEGEIGNKIPISTNVNFGGRDIDREILGMLDISADDLGNYGENTLLAEIEKSKITISEKLASHHPNASEVLKINDQEYEISDTHIEIALDVGWGAISDAIGTILETARERANYAAFEKLDGVLLAGGTSRLPKFKTKLLSETALKELVNEEHVLESSWSLPGNLAAIGLAHELSLRAGDFQSPYLLERASCMYGKLRIKGEDYFLSRKEIGQNKANHSAGFWLELSELDDSGKIDLQRSSFISQSAVLADTNAKFYIRTDLESEFLPGSSISYKLKDQYVDGAEHEVTMGIKAELKSSSRNLQVKPFLFSEESRLGERTAIQDAITDNGNKHYNLSLAPQKVEGENLFVAIDYGTTNTTVAILHSANLKSIPGLKPVKISKRSGGLGPEPGGNTGGGEITPDDEIWSRIAKDIRVEVSGFRKSIETQLENIGKVLSSPKGKNLVEKGRNPIIKMHDRLSGTNPTARKKDASFSGFEKYVKGKNYFYSEAVLKNVWMQIEAETPDITILSGPPGTGKTSLIRLVSNYLNSDLDSKKMNEYCKVIPISPDWYSSRQLLGYVSEYDNRFKMTDFLKCAKRAEYEQSIHGDNARTMVIGLDEFNIAQPEQYFADVLSLISISKKQHVIAEKEIFTEETRNSDIYVSIPQNLKIFATINTDHTSKLLSPKVLDRACLIQVKPTLEEIKAGMDFLEKQYNVGSFHPLLINNVDKLNDLFISSNSNIGFRTLKKIYAKAVVGVELKMTPKEIFNSVFQTAIIPLLPGADVYENEEYYKELEGIAKKTDSDYDIDSVEAIKRILRNYPGQF